MKRLTASYVFWVFCLLTQSLSAQTVVSVYDEINNCVDQYFQDKKFNGVVLVAKKGEVLYQKEFGYASIEEKIINSASTKFLIGSTTKSFTAIAVLQCLEKKLLDLHTPISSYIPELNKEVGKLTLHQLMKNSSGLPVHLNRITSLEYRDINSEELIELYKNIDLSFLPGTKYDYSNLNYQLCALVVERVSGLAYTEYMNDFIFKPLDMTNTGVQRTYNYIDQRAKGYELQGDTLLPATKNHLAYAMGGGDIYATALDLLKWDQSLYSEKILCQKSIDLLFDGKTTEFGGYGYGFKIKEYTRDLNKIGKLVRHGGSMYGFVCNIHRYLDDQVTIIILGNIRPYPIMEITTEIENILLENHYFR